MYASTFACIAELCIHTHFQKLTNTTSTVNYINTRSSHRVPCENLIHLVTSFQVPRDNFNYIK